MAIKLIIFDLDGTLVDTSRDITIALNHAIRPYGLKELSDREVVRLVGEGITRLIEKVLGEEKSLVRDEVVRRFIDYYSEHIIEYSTPYPYVRKTLEQLTHYKKAVISNKRESLSKRLLDELKLLQYFDIVVGSDTTPEKKPSPIPVLYILLNLQVATLEAVIVGDSNYDISAGKGAGIRTIAVTYGYKEKAELKDADYMINSLKELLPLLYESGDMPERRKEKRHPVPDIYQRYIGLKISVSEELIPVSLLDFSEHGIRLKSPIPFNIGDLIGCIISVPKSLTKDIAFKGRVRHYFEEDGYFIVGMNIEEVQDEVWFRIFKRVHDFISEKTYFHDFEE